MFNFKIVMNIEKPKASNIIRDIDLSEFSVLFIFFNNFFIKICRCLLDKVYQWAE